MPSNENKDSLKNAVTDIESILSLAEKSVAKKMNESNMNSFNNLIEEEIQKIKKESVKEPVNEGETKESQEVIDKSDKSKDEVKKDIKESNEVIDLENASAEEIEEAYDDANFVDEFKTINFDDVQKELSQKDETAISDEAEQESSNPLDEIQKMYETMTQKVQEIQASAQKDEKFNEFNHKMVEAFGEGYKETFGEGRVQEMFESVCSKDELTEDFDTETEVANAEAEVANAMNDPKAKKHGMNGIGNEINSEVPDMAESLSESVSPEIAAALATLIVPAGMAANEFMKYLKSKHPEAATAIERLASAASDSAGTTANIGGTGIGESNLEGELEVTEGTGEGEREEDEMVDEKHGVSFSDGKVNAGRHGNEDRENATTSRNRPQWSNESQTKLKNQIQETKKVTKKLNDLRKNLNESTEKNGKYNEVLGKYRKQLQEMAVFNSSLAYSNDILIKESKLSKEEIDKLTEEFRNVKTIQESEDKHRAFISVMNEAKTKDAVSIEEVLSESVGGKASKDLLGEAQEKTAYSNSHIDKIKKVMDYVNKK